MSKFSDVVRAIHRFHSSQTVKSLLLRIALFALYTAALVFLQMTVLKIEIHIDTIFLSLLGTLLSLLLVFRTNTAYDRFWEGRKQWGSLVNNVREFAILLAAALPRDDAENRTFFARYTGAFAFALKGHLRDAVRFEEFVGVSANDLSFLQRSLHVPNQLATLLFRKVQELQNDGVLSGFDVLNIRAHHFIFVDVTGACERIKRTPIPYSYNFYIKLFISAYLCLIPFMLIDKYGYYTIVAEMIATYALMGIEMIACEIEEPFGYDANDLPLDQMALTIRLNVHEILEVAMPDNTDELARTMRQ